MGSTAQILHQLVCIGFGATAISLAIALQERNALGDIIFLERQHESTWQLLSEIPAVRMRTSFLQDLVTSENPRSKFTFLNYLHATGKLITFANSSQINPSRELFDDYLKWCGAHFSHHVKFGKRVMGMEAVKDDGGKVKAWKIEFFDLATGTQEFLFSKQIICATGRQPRVPPAFLAPQLRSSVYHSSEASSAISNVIRAKQGVCGFAVIGDGQDAAEMYDHVRCIRGNHRVSWFTRVPVLAASGQSPFVLHAVKKPEKKQIQTLPIELRQRTLYGIAAAQRIEVSIQSKLLEQIYEAQYAQMVEESDPQKWRCRIIHHEGELHLEPAEAGLVRLSSSDSDDMSLAGGTEFDLVITATGYDRTEYQMLLSEISDLIDGQQVSVGRDYRVNFRHGQVSKDCGIFLQGLFGEGEDLNDQLYLVLSERSRIVVEAMLEERQNAEGEGDEKVDSVERHAHL